MEVSFSEQFKRAYRKRIGKNGFTEIEFRQALELFTLNPFEAKLKTHKLSGKLKGLWSLTVAFDVRVVFYFTNDKPQKAIFVDIGNHDEVY